VLFRSVDMGLLRRIGMHRQRAAATGLDARHHGCGACRIAGIAEHHVVAALGGQYRHCLADAAAAAGDHHDPAIHSRHLDAKPRTLIPSFRHLLPDMAAGCRLALYARNIAPLVQRGRGSCRIALCRTAAAMCALDLIPMPILFDTHAHLIADDWETYPPRPLQPGLPVPRRTDYTVTAEALVHMMDEHAVATSCVVQRGHLYGYDNSYIIDAARRFPDRLLPVVILDTQDPATPAALAQMARTQAVRALRLANTRPAQLDTS